MSKSFSVAVSLSEQGRKNHDRIFKPRKRKKGETNDTARIQEAIDEATDSGGGTVVIPRGTYYVGKKRKKPKKKAAK